MMRPRIGLQPLADLEAVHLGHHHVEKDNVDGAAVANLKRPPAVVGGRNLEILGSESRLEQAHVGRDIVDDQHARCHERQPWLERYCPRRT
jgi:hypothetical protein